MSHSQLSRNQFDLLVEAVIFASAIALVTVSLALDVSDVVALLSPDGQVSSRTDSQIRFVLMLAGIGGLASLGAQATILLWLRKSSREVIREVVEFTKKHERVSIPILLICCIGLGLTINLKNRPISEWNNASGAEYLDIATSIVAGHGFSMSEGDRWFWVDFNPQTTYDDDNFFPTAIEEPIYPYLLAAALSIFGDQGVLAIAVLQLAAWIGSCLLVYCLGKVLFGRYIGFFAAVSLALWPAAEHLVVGYLGPSPLGLLFFTAIAYLITQKLGAKNSNWWVPATGLLLGLSALTLASSQIFIPIAAATVILGKGLKIPGSWGAAVALCLISAAVISPWTYRNWVTFGELVPIRTGMGLISHQGNPTLAGTFLPGPHICSESLGPIWTATDISDAINQATTDQQKEIAIYKRSFDCIAENAPPDYANFNEPQRDAFYLDASKEFIYEHPWTFGKMAFHKYLLAVKGELSWEQAVFGVLCLIGMIICAAQMRAIAPVIMVLAYFAPYALGIPWGYRYRFPIEPLVILFALYAIDVTVRSVYKSAKIRSHN